MGIGCPEKYAGVSPEICFPGSKGAYFTDLWHLLPAIVPIRARIRNREKKPEK